jgi:hypothetical protein
VSYFPLHIFFLFFSLRVFSYSLKDLFHLLKFYFLSPRLCSFPRFCLPLHSFSVLLTCGRFSPQVFFLSFMCVSLGAISFVSFLFCASMS